MLSGGWHGYLSGRCRNEDATVLRLAVGEGPSAICRGGGGQAGTWGRGVHRAAFGLRSENHPAGLDGVGPTRRSGSGSDPKKGGGRRPLTTTCPSLEANLRQLLEEFTAGDPMRARVLWTDLSLREVVSRV